MKTKARNERKDSLWKTKAAPGRARARRGYATRQNFFACQKISSRPARLPAADGEATNQPGRKLIDP
jgi:hypothetical protein